MKFENQRILHVEKIGKLCVFGFFKGDPVAVGWRDGKSGSEALARNECRLSLRERRIFRTAKDDSPANKSAVLERETPQSMMRRPRALDSPIRGTREGPEPGMVQNSPFRGNTMDAIYTSV